MSFSIQIHHQHLQTPFRILYYSYSNHLYSFLSLPVPIITLIRFKFDFDTNFSCFESFLIWFDKVINFGLFPIFFYYIFLLHHEVIPLFLKSFSLINELWIFIFYFRWVSRHIQDLVGHSSQFQHYNSSLVLWTFINRNFSILHYLIIII